MFSSVVGDDDAPDRRRFTEQPDGWFFNANATWGILLADFKNGDFHHGGLARIVV